jgi:hypothetical protein
MRTSVAIGLLLASLGCAAPAAADDLNLPARKPGLWQMSMNIAGHAMVTKQCVDAATDKEMMQSAFAKSGQKCATLANSRSGNTITIDSTCTLSGGMTTKTHATISGDFQSEYTIDAVTDMTGGPAQMPKHSEMKQDVKWAGACPAGMKPGDMQMPGMPGMPAGMPPINLKQLLKQQSGG